jgi:hypothetical protein
MKKHYLKPQMETVQVQFGRNLLNDILSGKEVPIGGEPDFGRRHNKIWDDDEEDW